MLPSIHGCSLLYKLQITQAASLQKHRRERILSWIDSNGHSLAVSIHSCITQAADKWKIVTFTTVSSSPDIYYKRLKRASFSWQHTGLKRDETERLRLWPASLKAGYVHLIKAMLVTCFEGNKFCSLKTTKITFTISSLSRQDVKLLPLTIRVRGDSTGTARHNSQI